MPRDLSTFFNIEFYYHLTWSPSATSIIRTRRYFRPLNMNRNKQGPKVRIRSAPREAVLSRGPRSVPPAWRVQRRESEHIVQAHATRVSVPHNERRNLEPYVSVAC